MKYVFIICITFVLGLVAAIGETARKSPRETMAVVAAECSRISSRTAFIGCVRDRIGVGVVRDGMTPYMKAIAGMKLSRCHDIAHVIGQEGAKRGNADELAACSESICGDGCYHGFLEATIARGIPLSTAATAFCRNIPDSESRSRVACFHGLGHGLGSLTGDAVKGLSYCDELTREGDRQNCGAGVLMELLQSSSFGAPTTKLPDDIISYCSSLPSLHVTTCMSNAAVYAYDRGEPIESAASLCSTVPDASKRPCLVLLGSLVYNGSGQNKEKTMEQCSRLDGDAQSECAMGMLQELVLSGRPDEAVTICGQLLSPNCFAFIGEKTGQAYGKVARDSLCGTLAQNHALECKGRKSK